MKKFAFLMILAVGLSSCSLFDVDVDSEISEVLDIYVPEAMAKSTDAWHPLVEAKEINARENDDVEEYADRIDEIVVNEIVATVLGVSDEDVVLSENTVFYILSETDSVAWSKGEAWPIYEDATFTFDNLGNKYDQAAAIIFHAATTEGESMFTIGVVGESSKPGINVQIEIKILDSFTVSIL